LGVLGDAVAGNNIVKSIINDFMLFGFFKKFGAILGIMKDFEDHFLLALAH